MFTVSAWASQTTVLQTGDHHIASTENRAQGEPRRTWSDASGRVGVMPLAPRYPIPRLGTALAVAIWLVAAPALAPAQTLAGLTASPDSAAALFIRSIRAMRWSAAAQFMDPEPLAFYRDIVTMITEPEQAGDLLEYLTGVDSSTYASLDAPEVFQRALTTLTRDMPGLSYNLQDRDDEFLGHVLEGPDSAHVVYRTQSRISGALPEVKVMQMRRGPQGWRVLWSDELDVLETALRGAGRGRPGPGGRRSPTRRSTGR